MIGRKNGTCGELSRSIQILFPVSGDARTARVSAVEFFTPGSAMWEGPLRRGIALRSSRKKPAHRACRSSLWLVIGKIERKQTRRRWTRHSVVVAVVVRRTSEATKFDPQRLRTPGNLPASTRMTHTHSAGALESDSECPFRSLPRSDAFVGRRGRAFGPHRGGTRASTTTVASGG